jgi:hypothetical protein
LGIIQHWGYPGEQHKVNTTDGYVLTIQRIPCGKGQTPTPNRPVPHAFGVHNSTISQWGLHFSILRERETIFFNANFRCNFFLLHLCTLTMSHINATWSRGAK